MTGIEIGTAGTVEQLREYFGDDWDPEVMAYEEPHIFKSTRAIPEGARDAER